VRAATENSKIASSSALNLNEARLPLVYRLCERRREHCGRSAATPPPRPPNPIKVRIAETSKCLKRPDPARFSGRSDGAPAGASCGSRRNRCGRATDPRPAHSTISAGCQPVSCFNLGHRSRGRQVGLCGGIAMIRFNGPKRLRWRPSRWWHWAPRPYWPR
jgi:hypothetical protein